MGNDALQVSNPFEISAQNRDEDMRALASTLEYSQGLKLIFVRCNETDERRHLIAEFQKHVSQKESPEIHFNEPVTQLRDSLQIRFKGDPKILFVSGLEYTFQSTPDTIRFFANIDTNYKDISRTINCPVVIFVPDRILTFLARDERALFYIYRSNQSIDTVATRYVQEVAQTVHKALADNINHARRWASICSFACLASGVFGAVMIGIGGIMVFKGNTPGASLSVVSGVISSVLFAFFQKQNKDAIERHEGYQKELSAIGQKFLTKEGL
jgi:hypothetical protein